MPSPLLTLFTRLIQRLACLVLLGCLPALAAAQESPEAIWRAANDLHNPHSQAIVLKHINEIHALRGAGALNDSQYQAVMFWHQSENLAIARRAVGGLKDYELSLQRPAPDAGAWRTGSDTDFLIRRKDGKPVTLEDIQRVERAYRQASTHEIRTRSGGRVQPDSARFDTSTDFMVAHDATTTEEFSRIATHFAGRGADTYSRIEAARVEAQLRTPGAKVDYLDGGMYVAEMVDQAQRKQVQIDDLRRQLSGATQGQRSTHEARISQLEYERNKYLKRIDSINEQLRGQAQAEFGRGVATAPTVAGMQNLSRQARLNYAQTLGNILRVMPEGPQARQANFVLALQLVDVPAAQRTATLSRLDPKVQLTVRAQLQEFATWRRAEQERVSREDVITMQNFLHQTEFGQQLLRVFGSEIEALTTRPTESSRFMADVYRDLAAIDQTIQNRAQSLAMWLDLMVQARDAKSDAELAIALGRTLASKTYYGMIASYAYTGLVERDATALAKSLILLLCPKAALPQVVQAIGSSVIDLTSAALFDHQFMVLYVTANFEDGRFVGLQGFQEGPDAVCHFVREALQPGGHHWVEGVFTRALALAKERNFSQEVLSGVNAFGTRAFVRALESTVYGGSASFMGQHHGVQQARAEVARLTGMINDFAEGLGSEVALQADGSWAGLSRFEPAAQRAFRQLFELRVAAWAGVEAALCAAITEALEVRHRADQGLAGGDAAALALLAEVERLFRELDIHELGMSWLNYEGSRNVIMRWLGSTDEQRIEAMAALQRYHDAYAAVHEIRSTLEGLHLAASGGAESLYARPLTGSPPLTADPAFDHRLAAHLLQDVMEDMSRHEAQLLRIKRHALNDNRALLDTDFDRQTYQAVSAAVIGLHDARATMDGAAHAQQRLYRVQVLATHELNTLHRRAFERAGAQREQLSQLEAAFRAHYSPGEAALDIVPPAAVIEARATPHTLYAFGLKATHLPPEAVYVWFEDGREIGRGETLLYAFEKPGERTLSVEAAWSASERTVREGSVGATLTVNIRDDVPASALAIRPPEDLGAVANLGRAYAFRAEITHLPEAARLTWRINGQTAAGGAAAQLRFDTPGPAIVELSAEWEVPGGWTGHEVIDAPAFIIEVAPLEPPEPEPDPKPDPKPEPEQDARPDDPHEQPEPDPAPPSAPPPHGEAGGSDFDCGWPVNYGSLSLRSTGQWSSAWFDAADRQHGPAFVFFDYAKTAISEVVCHFEGQRHGRAVTYTQPTSADGQGFRLTEGLYRQGVQEGVWRSWHPDSTALKIERHYRQGKLHGESRMWWANGRLLERGRYANGNKVGEWVRWDENGICDYVQSYDEQGKFQGTSRSCKAHDHPGDTAEPVADEAPPSSPPTIDVGGLQGQVYYGSRARLTAGVELPQPARSAPVDCVEPGADSPFSVADRSGNPFRYCADIRIPGVGDTGGDAAQQAAARDPNKEYVPSADDEGPDPAAAPSDYRYIWHTSPGLTFEQTTTDTPYANVTYDRMGKILVWVQMLVREGNTWRTHAESEPVEVEVVAPRFALQIAPASGEAYIGDEVRVRIESQPGVAAALIDYRWLEPRFGNRREYGNNGSEIGFVVQDDQPLALEVHARVPFYGDEIAILTGSYSGRGYEVSIPEPRRPGPPAQIWDAVAGGLVDAPSGAIVVHQEIYLEARMAPRIPDGVRYRWRVTPDGARVFSPGGRETRFSAHEPGTYSVALAVHDAEGRLLGSASRDLSVMADGIPAGHSGRPPGDDEMPPGDSALPPGDRESSASGSSGAEGTSPGEKGTPSGDEGTSSGAEGASSGDEGTSSGDEGTSSGDEGIPPGDEGDDPPPPDQNDARARQLYRSAQDAWKAGDITTAVSLAAEAAQLAPGLADIVAGAADLAERARRIAGHIDAMREQARRGQLDEAIRSAQAALDLNPAYADAQRNLQRLRYLKEGVDRDLAEAERLIEARRFDEADAILLRLRNTHSRYAPIQPVLQRLARARAERRDAYNAAEFRVREHTERREFEQALAQIEQMRSTFRLLASEAESLRNSENFLRPLLDRKNAARRQLESGAAKLQGRDYSGAIADLQAGLQAQNVWGASDPEPNHYGPLLRQARDTFARIEQLRPHIRQAAQGPADALALNQLESALHSVDEVLGLMPGDAEFIGYRAQIVERLAAVREQGSEGAPAPPPDEAPVPATTGTDFKAGEPIVIGYTNLPGNRQDWITLVKKDMPDNQYSEWFFTEGKTSGTVTFKPLPAGEYELRVYHDWPTGQYTVQQRRRIVVKDAASAAADSATPVSPQSAAPSAAPPAAPSAGLLPEQWSLRANNHPGVLELSPAGNAGRVRIDAGRGWEVLDEVSFDGTTLRFARPLDAHTQHYVGTVDRSGGQIRISGTFTQRSTGERTYHWSATETRAASTR